MSPAYDWRQMIPIATEHDRRAMEHRPTDSEQMRREVWRLSASGLKAGDIGSALGLNPEQVRAFLDEGVSPCS